MDNMEHISVSNEAAHKLLEYIFSPQRLIDDEDIGFIGYKEAIEIEQEGFRFYANKAEDEAASEGAVVTQVITNAYGFPEERKVVVVRDNDGTIIRIIDVTKAINAANQRGMEMGIKFALEIIDEQDERKMRETVSREEHTG